MTDIRTTFSSDLDLDALIRLALTQIGAPLSFVDNDGDEPGNFDEGDEADEGDEFNEGNEGDEAS